MSHSVRSELRRWCGFVVVAILLLLVWALDLGSTPARAWSQWRPVSPSSNQAEGAMPSSPAAELHVCPIGCAYSSVQGAVDAAGEGDVIKVAAGTYTGVQARPRADITTTGVVTQVVYISKSLTIQGGYTTTNWTTPDPGANPTTLDALGQGRVLYISGDISTTVGGLRITGGDAAGQGGWLNPFPDPGGWDEDAGGGLYVITASATIKDSYFSGNVSPHAGGGAAFIYSNMTFSDNTVLSNSAGAGGGLFVESAGSVIGNTISGNTADSAGGLELWGNRAVTVEGNLITGNIVATHNCGGVHMFLSPATVRRNTISANVAEREGGGLCMMASDGATLESNVVADNQAGTVGSGLYIVSSSARLSHNTVARNGGGDGIGVYITVWDAEDMAADVTMTNTLLADHPTGIRVTTGCTVTVNGALWHNTATTVDAEPGASVIVANELTGDPDFVDPDAGDYHIGPVSAARDAGVDSHLVGDMDGQARPMGWGYDLGADEYPDAHLDLVKGASTAFHNPGDTLTYTISLTSGGVENATGVVLTDTLDAWQRVTAVTSSPEIGCAIVDGGWGGRAVCSPGTMVPGTSAVVTLTAEISTAVSARQTLVNQVRAGADETRAAAQAAVHTQNCHVRVNDLPIEYGSVQGAVDVAAPGDLVKVAGTCLGANDYAGLRQQVYLDKSLTIRGGYTSTNWVAPDPEAHPTTLDAEGEGRVLYITGENNVAVEGLHITGGNAAGLGGPSAFDAGGGIYAISATLTLKNSQVHDNAAFAAAGLWLSSTQATLTDNGVHSNAADFCGGLGLEENSATLSGNTIAGNTSRTWSGGGLCAFHSQLSLSGDSIVSNAANGSSGGLFVHDGSEATMTNVLIADNQAGGSGGGLRVIDSAVRLLHTTIARNISGDGSGVMVDPGSTVSLTNTVLVNHGISLSASEGTTVILDGVLWHSTPITVSQSPAATVTVRNQHWGNPAFAADGYHLTAGSAAIDRGIDAGVTVDIDGEARPVGTGYDLGADEDGVVTDLSLDLRADPEPVIVGTTLTHTLVMANLGPAEASGVILTDTLPASVAFSWAPPACSLSGATLTCYLGNLAAGAAVTTTVLLTPTSVGQLISFAEVKGNEADANPADNLDVAYVSVVPVPPPDPVVTAVTPNSGTNDEVTIITIDGGFFQDGAAASLDGTPLQSILFVNDGRLLAVVPNGLAPGTYDLTVTKPGEHSGVLPRAFTVLTTDPPAVTTVSPSQGPNDMPVSLDIRGVNFSPEVTASLQWNGEEVPLVDLAFMDSTHLMAVVPVSTTSGLYGLVVANPDGQSGALADAFQVLEPAESNDLYADPIDLWLDPPAVHAGSAITLGLTLHRQGGQADLMDVDVRFYLEGGVPTLEAQAAVLPPRSAVTVTIEWTPPAAQGVYTLYAQIDPEDEVPENNDTNNLISRTVTVLPPLPDITPPVVESLAINYYGSGSYLYTADPGVTLDTVASDEPGGSGVAHLLFIEYVLNQSEGGWDAVQWSGWLPYETARTRCAWRLVSLRGVHYIQVWAADGAGNISPTPSSQMINYLSVYYNLIYGRQAHVYRQPMDAGALLRVDVSALTYESGFLFVVWDPDGQLVAHRTIWGSGSSANYQIRTHTMEGTYQIEIIGILSRSRYWVRVLPTAGSETGAGVAMRPLEGVAEQPVVPPSSVPGRHVGIPSAPVTTYRVFLPTILRDATP